MIVSKARQHGVLVSKRSECRSGLLGKQRCPKQATLDACTERKKQSKGEETDLLDVQFKQVIMAFAVDENTPR